MALEFSTGAETGTPSTIFDALAGPVTIATDFPATGQGCFRMSTADQYGRKDLTANAIKVAHFRLRVSTFAGADFKDIVRFQNNASTNSASVGLGNDADRRLFFTHTFGGTILDTYPALSPNVYYRIEFIANATTNPWSMSWRVDGVDQGTFAPAQTGTTWDRVFVGLIGSDSFDIRIDDVFVYSGSIGDYPPGDLHEGSGSARTESRHGTGMGAW